MATKLRACCAQCGIHSHRLRYWKLGLMLCPRHWREIAEPFRVAAERQRQMQRLCGLEKKGGE